MTDTLQPLRALEHRWETDVRWRGIRRAYTGDAVRRLRNSFPIRHTLAERGAERLWRLLHEEPYINALGALTGNQAMQQVRAGLKAIYLSGWQVAADANNAGQMYPDQSLYPSSSVPDVVRRINQTLLRADQIHHAEAAGRGSERKPLSQGAASTSPQHRNENESNPDGEAHGNPIEWLAPIVADAEAGFGGVLHAFELMKAMIEAGAAGVHFEDQLASEKKCGHLGGKVMVPTGQFIGTLVAARLAADVLDVPSIVVARTDADSAKLITSDVDERDHAFITRERTPEGFYKFKGGLEAAIARGLAYAPYADLIWCETSTPDLAEARQFAEGIHREFPGKLLAYNCSPSFNWAKHLDGSVIAKFQRELGAMGYKFQFVTLAGFHALNYGMWNLARDYKARGMAAYSELQQAEFAGEAAGYRATKHQREVGTGYFDLVKETITGGLASTTAMSGSTEEAQFA